MKKIISKELLSLVLEEEVIGTTDLMLRYNELEYHVLDKKAKTINLDTLGRLCKEWCYSNKSIIDVEMVLQSDDKYSATPSIQNIKHDFITFSALAELEAIIKATEWIQEQL